MATPHAFYIYHRTLLIQIALLPLYWISYFITIQYYSYKNKVNYTGSYSTMSSFHGEPLDISWSSAQPSISSGIQVTYHVFMAWMP